jgi:glycosyltransferase involved in cell wall biosynthesis
MVRVGFVLNLYGREWLGGINYLNNLLSAISSYPGSCIDPVVLAADPSSDSGQMLVHRQPLLRIPAWARPAKVRGLHRIAGPGSRVNAALLERYLRHQRIDVLSHSGPLLSKAAAIPSLCMIYDLQHKRLPELFSPQDRRDRDDYFMRQCLHCSTVIVSSKAAYEDLRIFYPCCADRGRVLHFVANIDLVEPTPLALLRARYALGDRYFVLPNQFWVHKNHRVVIEALRILKTRNERLQVLCTGHQGDYRSPGHFEKLMGTVRDHGLEGQFLPVGVVPYADLIGLMIGSVGIINPSLFEGWSTSVEEAKSLGKQVLLSDIAVHREQQPARARYFEPEDAESLSELLLSVHRAYDPGEEVRLEQDARRMLPARMGAYARQYEDLVLEAIGTRRA